ncbi:MAG: hypothetical protein HC888_16435 [Candidatus Competibacteraceae bacterium]|nr:hypothetical protein [Candidatus Competibacteraceae bacterium]
MAGEAQAVTRLYQGLGMIAQVDPSVLDNFDHDEAVQILGRGWAVPSKIMRGADKVKELRAQRQQAQAIQQSLAMGAQGADVMKKVADSAKSGAQASEVATKSGQQAMGGADVTQAIEMLRGALRNNRPAA